jgi:hypothetical protein
MPELTADPRAHDNKDDSTKVTVKLTAKSVDALQRASGAGGLNRTDTVNRALQLYDFVLNAVDDSDENALIIERNGKQERILFR